MNKLVYESVSLNHIFNIKKIGISYSKNVSKLGKFDIKKPFIFFKVFLKTFIACLNTNTKVVYFQPSITGLTYFRDLFIILLCKLFGKKIILHLHGKGIKQIAEKNKLSYFLYKLGFKNSFLIVLSESQKKDIDFTYPKKIFVLNNGIPVINITDIKDRIDKTFTFLYLSNLLKSKGILDLIEACKKLKDNNIGFKLNIIGSEGDINKQELQTIIDTNNLTNEIKYHGPKYNEDKNFFFLSCDIFVFPTKNEAFGIVLLEAMQFGLPIIASNEGAIPEIIDHGQSGFIFPKGDTNQLYNYMKYCIENKNILKEMGKNGKMNFEEKFTFQKFETNLLTIFNNVIQDNN